MNVGASSPEGAGLYFSWGNTDGHEEGSGYDFSQITYEESEAADIDSDLSLEHDMARANLGQPWRSPTKEDYLELYNNCTSVWTTRNGVAGRLFTSNVNGNIIFFPAAGYYDGTTLNKRGEDGIYWSSSYFSPSNAYSMYFDNSSLNPQYSYRGRRSGFVVRAVAEP